MFPLGQLTVLWFSSCGKDGREMTSGRDVPSRGAAKHVDMSRSVQVGSAVASPHHCVLPGDLPKAQGASILA